MDFSMFVYLVAYYSVQAHASSRLLSNNLKIKIHKTILLPAVLYSCETWSLTLKQDRGLRVFENKISRRISVSMRDEGMGKALQLRTS